MQRHSSSGEAAPRGYELRVLILLGLAFGFAYFDRMALTFLAPFVIDDLGLSFEQISWANSGLSLTWALGAYLIGRWSDLSGKRKPFLIGALLLFSACSILSGLAWSFESLLATRIVMGMAEGPFLPICLAIMAAASSPHRQALNAGIVQNVFGPIVGTALASYALVRIAAAYDWHAAFFVAGIPGLILAFLIWRFVDEPVPAARDPATAPSRSLLPLGLLAQRNILACSLVSACAVGSIVVGSIFMPLYLDGPRGYDDLTWSNVMAVVGFGPAVGAIVVALLSDRIGRKWPLVAVAAWARPTVSVGMTPMNRGKVPRPIQLKNISAASTSTGPSKNSSASGAITISEAKNTKGHLRPMRSDSSATTIAPTAGQKPTTVMTLLQVRSS